MQALRLCTGRRAHRGSRGVALLFLDYGGRRDEELASSLGRSLPPVPIVQEAGWAPGLVYTGVKNLVPTGKFFVRYDFIQCSIVVHTRDIIGNKKSLSDVLLYVMF